MPSGGLLNLLVWCKIKSIKQKKYGGPNWAFVPPTSFWPQLHSVSMLTFVSRPKFFCLPFVDFLNINFTFLLNWKTPIWLWNPTCYLNGLGVKGVRNCALKIFKTIDPVKKHLFPIFKIYVKIVSSQLTLFSRWNMKWCYLLEGSW